MDIIKAPAISAQQLWSMPPEQFNDWRRDFDYPRIILFLKNFLTCFPKWLQEQNVSDQDLLEFGPAVFLREENRLMIYDLRNSAGTVEREISTSSHSIGEVCFHQQKVLGKKVVIPYFEWVKSNNQCKNRKGFYAYGFGGRVKDRSVLFCGKLELVDAGNINLPAGYLLSGRNLEFLNLDDLTIESPWSNSSLKLWYGSAMNLKVIGDLAFVDAYQTPFCQPGGSFSRTKSMNLINGNFQNWSFKNCSLSLKATNSTLNLWDVEGVAFECVLTLEHSELRDCNFTTKSGENIEAARRFHRHVKQIYSQTGDRAKAGEHFYKEKNFEQKSLMRPKFHYCSKFRHEKNFIRKGLIYLDSYSKFISSAFWNLLWGFGERPHRVFGWALFVIGASAIFYYCHPSSSTFKNEVDSLYFSLVTFATLGYGDIQQKENVLKIWASIEALLGLTLMAMLIAGFASKSKDY